jgi:hypothetical protein
MGDLSTKEREALRKDQFAYVDREGGEHLPIHDESHVRNAIARFNQTDFQARRPRRRPAKRSWLQPSATGSRSTRTATSASRWTDARRGVNRGRRA